MNPINMAGTTFANLSQAYLSNAYLSGGATEPSIYPNGIVGAWKSYGVTNSDTGKDVLKDYSGNGRDIYLKNLSYTLGSGYGIWPPTLNNTSSQIILTHTDYSFIIPKINRKLEEPDIKYYQVGPDNNPLLEFNLLVSNLSDLDNVYACHYLHSSEFSTKLHNGINYIRFDISKGSKPDYPYISFYSTTPITTEISCEIVPRYQGGLVFDGINDYGICESMPIFTKERGYTVVALRKWLSDSTTNTQALLGKSIISSSPDGALILEYRRPDSNISYNFGASNPSTSPQLVTYQTAESNNGTAIISGDKLDTNTLGIGCRGTSANFSNMVFYSAEIYDRNLSIDEINAVKERMLAEWYEKAFDPAAQEYQALWTANGKTNANANKDVPNLVDATNPLKLSNFAYAGNSGYQLFNANFLTWIKRTETAPGTTATNSTIHFTKTSHLNSSNLIEDNTENLIPSFKVKVMGLTSTLTLKYMSDLDVSNATIITKDGVYTLPSNNSIKYYGFRIITTDTVFPATCDVLVEQIPEGEGLFLDGVDDSFTSAKNLPALTDYTIVGDLEFLPDKATNNNKGIFKNGNNNWYWYGESIRINGVGISGNTSKTNPIGFNSNGLIVDTGTAVSGSVGVGIPTNGNISTVINGAVQMNFQSLAIPTRVLNEEQIRATYEYLKTLKANNI